MTKHLGQSYRQGDVLLISVEGIPPGFQERKSEKTILAYGEVTGHHHRFEDNKVIAFYKEGDPHAISGGTALRGSRTDVEYVAVMGKVAKLLHEEHSTIPVKSGVYRVVRQREYSIHEGIRRVAD